MSPFYESEKRDPERDAKERQQKILNFIASWSDPAGPNLTEIGYALGGQRNARFRAERLIIKETLNRMVKDGILTKTEYRYRIRDSIPVPDTSW